jgi:Ca2+-binding RTX toxin-like protein
MSKPIESLESRTLLSATLAGGVLTITGTDQADEIKISVSKDGKSLAVKEEVESDAADDSAGGDVVRPFHKGGGKLGRGKHDDGDDNDADETVTTFTLADVKSIVINAGAGNDHVSLGGTRKAPLSIAAEINGGDGNDNLRGGAGNDSINGGAGNDHIDGGAGNDNLGGGDGNDKIVGGLGDDTFTGGNGNDVLLAADGGGKDVLDGGANDATPVGKDGKPIGDRAVVDSADTVSNVEHTKTLTAGAKGNGGKSRNDKGGATRRGHGK